MNVKKVIFKIKIIIILKLEGKKMLVEQKKEKEFCPICGFIIEENDYIYRHKGPSGYKCSNCGFFELIVENQYSIHHY